MRCSGKHEAIANNNMCYLSIQLCMYIKTGERGRGKERACASRYGLREKAFAGWAGLIKCEISREAARPLSAIVAQQ